MIFTPLLVPAGFIAGVFLTILILYNLLSRFRPPSQRFCPPPPKSTAEDLKKVLCSIPVISYADKIEGDRECSVCIASFEEGEKVRFLPDCGHCFHARCIDEWLCSHLSCPFCRSPVKAPAKRLNSKTEAAEALSGSRAPLMTKMAFWRNRACRSLSSGDSGSNGRGEYVNQREESSPV